MCDQLPQAVVSIGASLYLKQKTQSVWNEMVEQICRIKDSKSSLNDIQKVVYVSYNHLPMHLKNCLLYCSIFPAGHLLLPERLIQLWIAEGFIEKQGSSQPEEIAYSYLMELICWGFLQVMDLDELGGVASCRIPIVVHELALSSSQKEESGAACHGVKLA
uniref:Disease resistance protein winged helix domain-containing protein n=1 Tax=Arundo donax TaxID=35708 RepID=A0A0A9DQJ5_ARUDO